MAQGLRRLLSSTMHASRDHTYVNDVARRGNSEQNEVRRHFNFVRERVLNVLIKPSASDETADLTIVGGLFLCDRTARGTLRNPGTAITENTRFAASAGLHPPSLLTPRIIKVVFRLGGIDVFRRQHLEGKQHVLGVDTGNGSTGL